MKAKRVSHQGTIENCKESRQMWRLKPSRKHYVSASQDEPFNLIKTLEGTWISKDKGWNLIALPFKDLSALFSYRVLMNQYAESLTFKLADTCIPNRGITPDNNGKTDQLLNAVDYEQLVCQLAAEDSPVSNLRAPNDKGIHHEPGLFLQILNPELTHKGNELTVARLATNPHGNSVLAMGTVEVFNGPPTIPDLNALPVRVNQDIEDKRYLAPYKHFEDSPFFGTFSPSDVPEFPGFFPTNANAILRFDNPGSRVKRTTRLHFDTKLSTGGIISIPFIIREANATEMVATFWIMELEREDKSAPIEFMMQYSQTVFLDFVGPSNQLVRWPHVSINTLIRGKPEDNPCKIEDWKEG